MSDDKPGCYWRGHGESRALKGRHTDGCAGQHCKGCEPCPDRHCICCGIRHSLDQTCPTCLHDVREDLDLITHMLGRLREQALNGSTLSGSGAVKLAAAAAIPGGDAMVELGPFSDGSAAIDPEQRADEHVHPDSTISHTITSWALDWTEQAGGTMRHPFDPDHVTWAAKYHPAFNDFVTEIRQARTRLEDVTGDGERPDRGAPCFVCHRPLMREYGDDDASDRWWCDRCRKSFGVGEYVSEVGRNYRANAEWLTAEDIETTLRIPRGSLSSWASKGYVRKKRDINTGRVVYSVKDAVTRRDMVA